MPVTHDRLTRLREFGLSEYAARAYLALLDLGIAEARDVSSISKVPQAKIYHVLEQLHEKGLVVILPEFPKKYAPIPFEEYLTRLFDEHTKAARAIEDEREELAEMFRVLGHTDVGDRGFFTVIRGRRNVLSKIEEMVVGTKRDLLVLGTAGTVARATHFLSDFTRARERGVAIRMMLPVGHETIEKLAKLGPGAELRARDLGEEEQSGKVAIVIADGATAFLIHFVPDDENLYAGKDIGVFTDQEAMVAAIQAIVEPLWNRAPPVDKRREEIREGRPPEFTRVYASVEAAREAVRASLADGVVEMSAVSTAPAIPYQAAERAMGAWLRERGVRMRSIVNVGDLGILDEIEAGMEQDAGWEIRHLQQRFSTRYALLGDREAFFSIGESVEGGGVTSGDVVVHTNAPHIVASLRRQFDTLWASSMPLSQRRRELELFPDVQPSDLGIGRIFDLLGDAVVVADEQGGILLWNTAAARIFGHTPEEARRLRVLDLLPPSERAAHAGRFAAARGAADHEVVEALGVRKDGREIDLEFTLSAIDGADGRRFALIVARDVGPRRDATSAQLRSTQRLLRTYERISDAFLLLDGDWRIAYMNPVANLTRVGGLAREDILGRGLWELFPQLKGTVYEEQFRRAASEGVAVKFEARDPVSGRWYATEAYPADEGLSIYYRDVTDQRAAQAGRTLAEQRLHALLSATPVGVGILTPAGHVVEASERFAQMLGREPRVMPKLTTADFIGGRDRERLAAVFDRLAGGSAPSERVNLRLLTEDGEGIATQAVVTPVRSDEGDILEFILHVQPAPAA